LSLARELSDGWGEMKARYFNSIMPAVNHQWAAEVLGMEINSRKGPDLISDNFNMELKFSLTGKECLAEKYHIAWTVMEHQTNYHSNGKEHFWGFGAYSLVKPVSKIRAKDNLESCVLERELWIVLWNFIDRYEKHDTRGKSKTTGVEWHNVLVYPKLKDLPDVIKSFEVERGKIHFTEGMNFELLGFI